MPEKMFTLNLCVYCRNHLHLPDSRLCEACKFPKRKKAKSVAVLCVICRNHLPRPGYTGCQPCKDAGRTARKGFPPAKQIRVMKARTEPKAPRLCAYCRRYPRARGQRVCKHCVAFGRTPDAL